MRRLAGYQLFCWLAVAFITLGGTSSHAAVAVVGAGLASVLAGVAIRRAGRRRVSARQPRV